MCLWGASGGAFGVPLGAFGVLLGYLWGALSVGWFVAWGAGRQLPLINRGFRAAID